MWLLLFFLAYDKATLPMYSFLSYHGILLFLRNSGTTVYDTIRVLLDSSASQ